MSGLASVAAAGLAGPGAAIALQVVVDLPVRHGLPVDGDVTFREEGLGQGLVEVTEDDHAPDPGRDQALAQAVQGMLVT